MRAKNIEQKYMEATDREITSLRAQLAEAVALLRRGMATTKRNTPDGDAFYYNASRLLSRMGQ